MKKIRIFKLSIPFAMLAGGFILIWFSAVCRSGISKGLEICGSTIIPSLFPFLCFSNLCVLLSSEIIIPRFIAKLHQRIFRLPSCTVLPVFFGLTGGYPIGPAMAAELYKSKKISRTQAKYTALFCCNSGPAFSVAAVGMHLCGSRNTGLILFASTVVSTLLTGFVLAPVSHGESSCKAEPLNSEKATFSSAFIAAIEKSTYAMLKICAWILFFSMLYSLIANLNIPEYANQILSGIFEVTMGCTLNAGNPAALAAILGFGGISVHFQIKEYLNCIGIKTYEYFAVRLLNAGLCVLFTEILLTLFPEAISVFAPGTEVIPTYSGYPFSVALVFSLAVFIMSRKKSLL